MLSIYIIIKAASTGKKFIEEKYSLFREDSTFVYFPVTREVETCQECQEEYSTKGGFSTHRKTLHQRKKLNHLFHVKITKEND